MAHEKKNLISVNLSDPLDLLGTEDLLMNLVQVSD